MLYNKDAERFFREGDRRSPQAIFPRFPAKKGANNGRGCIFSRL
jgi:hypothetical protein